MCQAKSPIHHHVMLDPDEREELSRTPGLLYPVPGLLVVECPPRATSRIGKTSGMSSADESSKNSSSVGIDNELEFGKSSEWSDDDFDGEKTDQEVGKYGFLERLEHYMDGEFIHDENRKSVELAVMVEAGANVREMGVMTKELRANRFHNEYMIILSDIPDSRFGEEGLRASMMHRFKGMRKGEMTAENLLHKYEGELAALRRFAYKFPGVGDLSLVGNSERNSGEFQRISDSGPFFDPIFSGSNSGSDRITYSRQILAYQNYIPANFFPNFFIGKVRPPYLLAS